MSEQYSCCAGYDGQHYEGCALHPKPSAESSIDRMVTAYKSELRQAREADNQFWYDAGFHAASVPLKAALREAINDDLRGYITGYGVAKWWLRERYQLDGKTPEQVWESDPVAVWRLARGGRGQVAT